MTRLSTTALTVASMCFAASAALANPVSKWDKPAQDDIEQSSANGELHGEAGESAKDAMWNPLNPIWSKLPSSAAASFNESHLYEEASEANYSKGSLSQSPSEANYTKGSLSTSASEANYTKGSLSTSASEANYSKGSLSTSASEANYSKGQLNATQPVSANEKPGDASESLVGDCGGPLSTPNKPMPWEKPGKKTADTPDDLMSSMYVPGIGHFEVMTAK